MHRKLFCNLQEFRSWHGCVNALSELCTGTQSSTLVTDHYRPVLDEPCPTLLVRCPYRRGFPWDYIYGALFAGQGFHVVLQSCRGTGGSGGELDPFVHEAADARATVAWLRRLSLLSCGVIAACDAASGPHLIRVGLLIIGPVGALLTARWTLTAAASCLAIALGVALGVPDQIFATVTQ